MNKDNYFCKIKVTNLDTKVVYIHGKVPYEHVEVLKLNPNLEVDILGQHREGSDEERNPLQEAHNSFIF